MNRKEIENQRSKSVKFITLLFNILQIISMAFLLYSISLVGKIETTKIIIGSIVLAIINIVLLLLLRKLTKKSKKIKVIIFIIINILLIGGQLFVGQFVYRTYSSINTVNKNEITYKTDVVVLKDSKLSGLKSIKNKTIGIVVDETSIDGYIIANEIIEKNNLNKDNEIYEYTTISQMMKELYDGKVDVVIASDNYPSMLASIDTFNTIKEDTKIIYSKEKTYTKSEIAKISGDEIDTNKGDIIKNPFTVLVMGIDSTNATLDKNATGNGDALMLVTFNPKTLNATAWSVPRDTYVYITCLGKENKITHAGWGGESCMIKTLEKFTGIKIDYYLKVNFKGVVKIVDSLGGIDVDVPEMMNGVCEQDSNRNFGNQQCFKTGPAHFNGEQALAFARHRKTLALGDFQRGLNQQIIVQAMLNKIKSIRSTSKALDVLNSVSNSMDTNFTTNQLLSFYDIAKNLFATSNSDNLINLQQLYLMGQGQMIYDEGIGLELYNFIPNESSLNQITSTMKKNLGLEKPKDQIKTMDFNIEEPFEMTIIGRDNLSGTKTYQLLPSVVGKNVEEAKAILEGLGLTVTIEEKEVQKNYTSGQVISQSYPAGKRVDKITGSIKLVVAKGDEEESSDDTGESHNIVVTSGVANTETINYTENSETYSETDKGTISATLDGKDITSDIVVNVSYDDESLLTSTPLVKTYTVTYTVTYNGSQIKQFVKTVVVK